MSTGKIADMMNPFLIISKDLIIRPIISYDESAITKGIAECLKNLQMWLPWMEEKPDVADAPKIAKKFYSQTSKKGTFHFAVYRNEELMGMISFYELDEKNLSSHMGYWCKNDKKNEDYFIDALNATVKYAFYGAGLLHINISCLMGNFISEAAAKKLNFKLQGIQLLNQKQIKLYLLTCNTQLPQLNVSWVVDPATPMYEYKDEGNDVQSDLSSKLPRANERYLDESF